MAMSRTRALAIFWTFSTLVLHAIPRKQILEMPGGQTFVATAFLDKVAHVVLFGVLGFLWQLGFRYRVWTTVILGMGYGIVLELGQEWLIAGRSGSFADLSADLVGLLIGTAIAARGSRTDAVRL